MSFLTLFTIVIFLITVISLLNERFFKIPNDIALLLFTFSVCAVLKIIGMIFPYDGLLFVTDSLSDFSFESYLLDGVLCFMLFAGADRIQN